MKGYLGEFPTKERSNWTPMQWVLNLIARYGQIDGEHHKTWVLDQVARVLHGAPIDVREARWEGGHSELRYTVGTCEAYERWVTEMRSGEDGPETYDYDVGIAP